MRFLKSLAALVAVAVVVGVATPTTRATEIFAFTAKAGDPAVPAGAQVAMTANNTAHTLTLAFSGWGSDPISEFGFNVGNANGSSISAVTIQSGAPSGSTITTNGAIDGLGKFSYDLSFNGPGFSGNQLPANSTVVLHYTGTLNELDLLTQSNTPPGSPTYVGAHYQNPNMSGANTFFAVGNPQVPEPSSMVLLGTGLALGLAGVRRRWRSPVA